MDYASFLIDDNYRITNVIYLFKNKINGKVYVGQTTVQLRNRVQQHITTSHTWTKTHKSPLHKAINKYGISNFDLQIIERCRCQQELDERERYWIAYFNSTNRKYGYNIDSGGKKGKKTKPLSTKHKQKLLECNLGKKHNDRTKQLISNSHKLRWNDKEFYDKHIENFKNIIGWNKKIVYQYDLMGNFIKQWESVSEVSIILYGNNKASLGRNICLNINKNKLGFKKNGSIWSYIPPKERSTCERA